MSDPIVDRIVAKLYGDPEPPPSADAGLRARVTALREAMAVYVNRIESRPNPPMDLVERADCTAQWLDELDVILADTATEETTPAERDEQVIAKAVRNELTRLSQAALRFQGERPAWPFVAEWLNGEAAHWMADVRAAERAGESS